MSRSAGDSPEAPASKKARKTRPQLQNGYDCIFVDELPDHLPAECPICLCVFDNPQLVDCICGSHFCQSCINPIKAEKKPCPLCKGSFATSILDRHLQRTINSLQVYCSLKEAGCEWVGELKDLSQHLNVSFSDDYKSLGCPFVQLECSHCKQRYQRRLLLDHESSECSKRPVCCDICDEYESTFEDVINNHVPICPSKQVLCPNECGKSLLRKNLDKHLENDCPLQSIECLFSYAGCEVKLLRKDMSAHIGENLVFHTSLQAISHQKQLQKQASMQSEIDDLKHRLEKRIKALEDDVHKLKHDIDFLRSRQESLHTHVSVVPVHYVLSGFVVKKSEGKIWHSEPFYSSPRGYKMRLKVYTNGHKDGTNTHISVFIQLMCGEFDYQLAWPFHGIVAVELLDQEDDEDPWVVNIDFDGAMLQDTIPQVRKGERNTEWGVDKFIPHDMLCPMFYNIKNDSLYFKVSLVMSAY